MATLTGTLTGALRSPARALRRPMSIEGVWGWITTVDAKRVGILYGVTALVFMISGGAEAMIIRIQLARADASIVSPDTFNQLFTMHGTVMIFLVIMPLNAAFTNFIMPLMIGARDVAFPRLNALSYWIFLAAGLFIHLSFVTGGAPDAGWFSYANLTGDAFSVTRGIDYWILALLMLGIASVLSALNFIVTVVNMRAPGMSFMRLPMFVWMVIIVSFLIILAFPIITVALILLLLDRIAGTSFFVTSGGGDPVLWQHLFWIFGHPEVYILILPAMGIVSEILPTFARKPLFGYKTMVLSGLFIGVTGFAVWSHHMFSVGLGPVTNAFFTTTTMAIAIPTGVKIFNWLGTLWGGQLKLQTPMLFALGFIAMFVIGGLSGVMHASPPSDLQQTDTYFIVAHLHYVLFGGSLFGIFAGIYYWFPKVTGRLLNEGLGKLHFALFFIGGNLTFFPMHFLGMDGMPRRIYTYSNDLGLEWLNTMVTAGAFVISLSILIFFYNVFKTMSQPQTGEKDPWDGQTLEWTVPSPPPLHNFDRIPTVRSVRPLWDEKHPEAAEHGPPPANHEEHAGHNGHGHGHIHLPSPSYWPIVMAIGMTIVLFGLLYSGEVISMGLLVAGGGATVLISMFGWILEPVTSESEHSPESGH